MLFVVRIDDPLIALLFGIPGLDLFTLSAEISQTTIPRSGGLGGPLSMSFVRGRPFILGTQTFASPLVPEQSEHASTDTMLFIPSGK